MHEQNKQKLLLEQKRKQADRRAQIEARERKQQQQQTQQDLTGNYYLKRFFSKKSQFLERIPMDHIKSVCSLSSQLFFVSIRIPLGFLLEVKIFIEKFNFLL